MALLIEVGTTNRFPNPLGATGQPSGTVGYPTVPDATLAWSTVDLPPDPSVQRSLIVNVGANANRGVSLLNGINVAPAAPAENWSVSAWVKSSQPIKVSLVFRDAVNIFTAFTDKTTSGNGTWEWVTLSLVAPASTVYIDPRWETTTTSGAAFILAGVQVEKQPIPTSLAAGSLGSGYSWAGTAHASASTRAATTISIPSATFPASLAVRYSADGGYSLQHAYLTAPGNFGEYGTVAHSGGNIVISARKLGFLLEGVRADARVLTSAEKARLEAQESWSFAGLVG